MVGSPPPGSFAHTVTAAAQLFWLLVKGALLICLLSFIGGFAVAVCWATRPVGLAAGVLFLAGMFGLLASVARGGR